MRKLLITFVMFFSVSASATQFCDGFQAGYMAAKKQQRNSALVGMAPMCPMMPMRGFGDPQGDFEFGYTIGFRRALMGG